MLKRVCDFFLLHPKNVCMTYYQHFIFSSTLGFQLIIAGGKAFIHAIFPSLFITSTSDFNRDLKRILESAGCK